jgi:hypothetical protein
MEEAPVSDSFEFGCDWASPSSGLREVAETACALGIRVGSHSLSRADNEFSGSVTDNPPLSAYPLAAWIASSWWRLRWEGGVEPDIRPPVNWRMAHEMASAGMGFVWPPIRFESEGPSILLTVGGPRSSFFEPLTYLARGTFRVEAGAFERAIDLLIERVLTRLSERTVEARLRYLWKELLDERGDSEASSFRRMEAILGYDPDGAEPTLIEAFLNMRLVAGTSALDEIAHASSHAIGEPTTLDRTLEIASSLRVEGKISLPVSRQKLASRFRETRLPPWEIGSRLANEVRRACGNEKAPVSNRDLGDFFGKLPSTFQTSSDSGSAPPVSLAVLRNAEIGLVFRKSRETGKRFEAARLLGDYILNGNSDSWLPGTDSSSFRQKVQRSFAAQFLTPIDSLLERLNGKIDEDSVTEAASFFNVSPFAVQSHLVNNRVPGATLKDFAAT